MSNRVKSILPSGTIEIAAKVRKMKKDGIDVIRLETGEPDFATPRHIKEAALRAIKEGYSYYTSSRGIVELREALVEKLKLKNKIISDPEKEIIVTIGAKQALFAAILATINLGDEVLIFDPSWMTYEACVKIAGGIPVKIPLSNEDKFHIEAEDVEKRISRKTKMIVLNSPVNPTGRVLTREELDTIAEISRKNDLLVLSDEVYEEIIYDGLRHYSIAAFKDMKERTITVNSLSKTYAMTGWRLGYVVASENMINHVLKVQQHSITCACAFVQKAAIAALRGPREPINGMIREYERRRGKIVNGLNKINGISCKKPEGTFYVFPDISELGMSSLEISKFLLNNARVSVTPGSAFGVSGEGHLRLSFANSLKNIKEAVVRIEKALSSI